MRPAEFRVDRSDWALSSHGPATAGPQAVPEVRRPRPCAPGPRRVASAARSVAVRGRGRRSRSPDSRAEDRAEAELERLGDPALGVGDEAQLAGEPDLAEAGERPCPRRSASGSPRCAEASAMATARSAPGSSTRTPPATLTKTSAPSRATARRGGRGPRGSSPAGCGRSRSRRGAAARSRSARPAPGPRPAAGGCPPSRRARTSPGAVRGLADEARRRIGDLDQAAGAHLEHARPRWSRRSGS